MVIIGDGIGTIICSTMPPINIERGPWVLTMAKIAFKISVMRKSITGKRFLDFREW